MKLSKLTLTHYIFLGVLAGALIGENILPLADPLANIFPRLLRMAIMSLIVVSIMSGVLSIGTGKGLGSMGLKTFLYYITTKNPLFHPTA